MEVIKTISLSLMLSAIPQLLMAQDTFGEMIYSKVKTLFKLNAPTTVNLDGMTGATTQIDKKNRLRYIFMKMDRAVRRLRPSR